MHVFIVGCKGIPACYGGFETFVEKLTTGKVSKEINYHVSCMNSDEQRFIYKGVDCFNVRVPFNNAFGRMLHVSRALRVVERWGNNHPDQNFIIYILGCRIGPLLSFHAGRIHKLGGKIFCNPDGLEWKRGKWNWVAKQVVKICENGLIKYSDLVICDSKCIEKYVKCNYEKRTINIAYGANTEPSTIEEADFDKWCDSYNIKRDQYYVVVGRFVPENNFERIIKEFMRSKSARDLVIISNIDNVNQLKEFKRDTGYDVDKRIKIIGAIYDENLLKKIRENAYAYIHGHEVGGTNPSLLEAMRSTKLNLLLNVNFNKEVGESAVLYWSKKSGDLSKLIEETDDLSVFERNKYGEMAKNRISTYYSWDSIINKYESLFMEN